MAETPALRPLRVAVLASSNLDLLKRPLKRALEARGFGPDLHFSGFGLWEIESLDPTSALYEFNPDVVIVSVELEDLVPVLSPKGAILNRNSAQASAEMAWSRLAPVLSSLVTTLPAKSWVLCHNFLAGLLTPLGPLEGNQGFSYAAVAEGLNARLRDLAEKESRIVNVDYAGEVAKQGSLRWYDRRLWHLGRIRLSHEAIGKLAELHALYLATLLQARKKCLVLDLDNTLWGGIIGEDGMSGIQLGQSGLGLAFREFQMAILSLFGKGVILAISSKNNPEEVQQVFSEHSEMVLGWEHFAASEINWEDKATGIERLAKRLNIGLDSMVFLDDNPVERELVRMRLPEVMVPELPADPSAYASFLLGLDCFYTLRLTDEDRQRGVLYRQQAEREAFLSQTPVSSLEDYYSMLEMVVTLREADAAISARVAQLTQRTNQFNLTTRRYSERDILAMMADPRWRLFALDLEDKFGTYGTVGLAIVYQDGKAWQLDTFLMSCRALGRAVEEAFLWYVALQAESAGASLSGTFVPTKKNKPAEAFLQRNGLLPESLEDGEHAFEVRSDALAKPDWLTIKDKDTMKDIANDIGKDSRKSSQADKAKDEERIQR
jgi:FkbH-like protein